MTQIVDEFGKPIERVSRAKELADFAERFSRAQRATYDAARPNDDYDRYWANADSFDADSAHSPEVRQKLRNNSRYEITSNGISDGIASTYATDLVGTGPQLRMQTGNPNFNQMVERTFWSWSKAVKFRRKLWCMAHAKHVDGEAFAILRVNPKVKHLVKLDFALHEADQCATPQLPITDPNYIDGIKLDRFGNPSHYDFLKQHPGKANGMSFALEAEKVEADRVLHWFKMRRPGQHRGVPECASTLNLGAAFRRLREANLSTAEKVAAWTLFIKTIFEPDELDPVTPMSMHDIVHGMLTALPNNSEPFQLKAEHPGPTYAEFHKTLANEQGRPKGMPLNKTLCNSADYNYASGRLDHQTYYSYLDVDREDGNDLALDPLFETWFDLAIRAYGWLGGRPELVGETARFHIWDWPKHRVADIEAEANANQTKLKSGQIFPHRLFSDAGLDFEDEAEAAAQAFGVPVNDLKKRLFDVLLPPPKAEPDQQPMRDPAVAAVLNRAFGKANGVHHG